jgi:hypothetical protein
MILSIELSSFQNHLSNYIWPISPTGQRIFLLAPASRPALGSTQPPIQWVPGGHFPGGKARPRRDAVHSPPSSAEVKYE